MEDAVKALLIAAGIFFSILIVSTLVLLFNQISAYYTAEHEATVIEQTKEFNEKFENFNRKNIRGNDLISLMNRVIDYNAQESYFVDKSYKRILVDIEIGEDNLDSFKYEINNVKYGQRNDLIKANITNMDDEENKYKSDKQLIAITNTPSDLLNLARAKFPDIKDAQLQQLSSNISNIIINEELKDSNSIYSRYYRANILKDLLEWDVKVKNEAEWITSSDGDNDDKMELIKDITNKYYQYTQFKRALFDCETMVYDDETNRVVEMKFKLQIKDGKIVFD